MLPVAIASRAPAGLEAPAVTVEVFLGPGLPGLSIVGLVETAVKESRDRVRAAIQNSGFDMPDRHIVVNLAPADLPKSGSRYDLAIAVGILAASGQLPTQSTKPCEFIGELSLAGELRYVAGSLPFAMQATEAGRRAIVPAACNSEAGLLDNGHVFTARNLNDVGTFLQGQDSLPLAKVSRQHEIALPDMREVHGQAQAKRALEIAAAGGHNLLFVGPPGTGKSMLAERLPSLLPAQSKQEALETAAIYSLAGAPLPAWQQRPFRAPHHTATAPALAGGTSNPRPGEVSLAHNGVLFLDELPEFRRATLEVLREPLETGKISISRARGTITYPARFQLVAAMNPCNCGYLGDPEHECRCTPDQVQRYRQRISGPFLDRLDICIHLSRETFTFQQHETNGGLTSRAIRKHIERARRMADKRNTRSNAQLDSAAISEHCVPDRQGIELLENAANKLALSRRACDRVLRVARSIADLAGVEQISQAHVAEALSLRQFNA